MKILVTGGAGFIGSHLVEAYQGIAEEIRVLDNLKTGKIANLHGFSYELLVGSVADAAVVEEAVRGVDHVFHLAALANVPECLKFPSECQRINIKGLTNVLEASEAWGVSRLLFPSSASVYGSSPPRPTTERTPLAPNNPYARSKAEGEKILNSRKGKGVLSTCSLRFFNVFGPRQDPLGTYAAVIPHFILKALKNEDIVIFGDGRQTRDFVFVKDVVAALIHVTRNPQNVGPFNVGGSTSIGILDLAKEIIQLTGSSSRIRFQDSRDADARFSNGSSQKLRDTGWSAKSSLQAGLLTTIESMTHLLAART